MQPHIRSTHDTPDHDFIRAEVDTESRHLPGHREPRAARQAPGPGRALDGAHAARDGVLAAHLHLGLHQLHRGHHQALQVAGVTQENILRFDKKIFIDIAR